jgi:RND family efflux transporter MFP subunit
MNPFPRSSLAPWVVILLVARWVTGCSPGNSQTPAATAAAPVVVTVARPESIPFTPTETLSGRIDAVESVEIRPRVSGYLTEVRFQAGQTVRKGQVLFVIDPRPFAAAVQRAEAEVEAARVRLASADREAGRAEQMLKTQAISVEGADQRVTRQGESKAALAVAIANLETARLNLDYTQIRSPIDGRVGRALMTLGNNVSGMDGMNTLLTTVVSIDPVYVYADLDEAVLLRINRFRAEKRLPTDEQGRIRVRMGLADEEGFPHEGVVDSFDTRLDRDTGSLMFRVLLANPDERFVPGLFVRLSVPAGPAGSALVVPDSVIGTEQSLKFAYTVSSSNTVEKRFVVPGPLVQGKRVIQSGLQSPDRVVVNGTLRVLFPGQPVQPQEAAGIPPQGAAR